MECRIVLYPSHTYLFNPNHFNHYTPLSLFPSILPLSSHSHISNLSHPYLTIMFPFPHSSLPFVPTITPSVSYTFHPLSYPFHLIFLVYSSRHSNSSVLPLYLSRPIFSFSPIPYLTDTHLFIPNPCNISLSYSHLCLANLPLFPLSLLSRCSHPFFHITSISTYASSTTLYFSLFLHIVL